MNDYDIDTGLPFIITGMLFVCSCNIFLFVSIARLLGLVGNLVGLIVGPVGLSVGVILGILEGMFVGSTVGAAV